MIKKVDLHAILYGEPRPAKLSYKQNKLLRTIVEHPDMTLAAAGRVAGYGGYAGARGALSSSPVQSALTQFLETLKLSGVTDEKLAKKISEGLNATETKISSYEGTISDTLEVADFSTRKNYVELALKLKRLISTDTVEEKIPITIQIVNY